MIANTISTEHACAIAHNLGIRRILIHRYSSLLSAYGISLAEITTEATEPSSLTLTPAAMPRIHERVAFLKAKIESDLRSQDIGQDVVKFQTFLNLQYKGMDTTLSIEEPADGDYKTAFTDLHLREFAFKTNRDIVVDSIRVRGTAKKTAAQVSSIVDELQGLKKERIRPEAHAFQKVFLKDSWEDIPMYNLESMETGSYIRVSSSVTLRLPFPCMILIGSRVQR